MSDLVSALLFLALILASSLFRSDTGSQDKHARRSKHTSR